MKTLTLYGKVVFSVIIEAIDTMVLECGLELVCGSALWYGDNFIGIWCAYQPVETVIFGMCFITGQRSYENSSVGWSTTHHICLTPWNK